MLHGIQCASLKVVSLACKGMCRKYIDEYDVHTLVPERKLSFTDTIATDTFRCPDGASRGALTVRWDDYYWIAVDACFETLAEEGSRKDEVSKKLAQIRPFARAASHSSRSPGSSAARSCGARRRAPSCSRSGQATACC